LWGLVLSATSHLLPASFRANCGSLLWVTLNGTGQGEMRTANKLTAFKVARANKKGLYGDGNGLWLQVGRCGTKSWVLRYMLNGKPRYMGLGAVHSVTLVEARERARQARSMISRGVDPLDGKLATADSLSLTFDLCAEQYIALHSPDWKNPKHRAQWSATLATYASPVIGHLPVSAIDTPKVLAILEPIWRTKHETARRVRSRIENILDWAKTKGFREGENPALLKSLFKKSKAKKKRHHPALAYEALPAFMAKLAEKDYVSARALEFTILTASRTSEVIGARWVGDRSQSEDLDGPGLPHEIRDRASRAVE
jgi:hypothetical protein